MSFSVIVVLALALAVGGCDWPMFRYGPDRSGFSPDTGIGKDLVGSLVLNWTGNVFGALGAPAVANGVVYLGSADHYLYAFDAAGIKNCSPTPGTCAPLWGAPTGGEVQSSPAVVNGIVYVGSEDHKVYAFDAGTGAVKWTATTGDAVLSSPAVVDGIVYVGSYDDKLYALDATTGATDWTADTGGTVFSSPAIVNGVVYVGSNDGNLYAFDAAGTTKCSGIPKTCLPLWTARPGSLVGSPAVVNGVVYMGANNGKLYAFDATGGITCSGTPKTCNPLWTATTGGETSSPAVANGTVYVGSFDHNLYAYDATGTKSCSGSPKTCAPLWTAPTTNNVVASPIVADGVVYVGSLDRELYGFDAAGTSNCTGTPKTCAPLGVAHTFTTGGVLSLVLADGSLYAVDDRDTLYAFGIERVPPTTSVVQPSFGATISGTTTLVADAADDISVSKVEFHLTGGTYNDTLIGVASPTGSGWTYHWDTTTVPNGTYRLDSVATDPAGNVGRSGITITVGIPHCVTIATATETGNTVTITTTMAHGFIAGQGVAIRNIPVTPYNGDYIVLPSSPTQFRYTIAVTRLPPSGSGTACTI
jgi:outer membrane protein assembly factor BamB